MLAMNLPEANSGEDNQKSFNIYKVIDAAGWGGAW
jgi:hypothetical protein